MQNDRAGQREVSDGRASHIARGRHGNHEPADVGKDAAVSRAATPLTGVEEGQHVRMTSGPPDPSRLTHCAVGAVDDSISESKVCRISRHEANVLALSVFYPIVGTGAGAGLGDVEVSRVCAWCWAEGRYRPYLPSRAAS